MKAYQPGTLDLPSLPIGCESRSTSLTLHLYFIFMYDACVRAVLGEACDAFHIWLSMANNLPCNTCFGILQ